MLQTRLRLALDSGSSLSPSLGPRNVNRAETGANHLSSGFERGQRRLGVSHGVADHFLISGRVIRKDFEAVVLHENMCLIASEVIRLKNGEGQERRLARLLIIIIQ